MSTGCQSPKPLPSVGDLLPVRKVQMSLAKARLFSLPRESFHTHDHLAVKIGIPRAAPQGLMSYGYLSKLATDFFGPSWAAGGELNVNFVNLLDREDELTIAGRVAAVGPSGERSLVVLEIWVDSNRGVRIAAGEARGYVDAKE